MVVSGDFWWPSARISVAAVVEISVTADTWKANRIQRYGRYSFKGTAPKKGAKWHVLLRVVFKRQSQHRPKASRVLYIDENPGTRCG